MRSGVSRLRFTLHPFADDVGSKPRSIHARERSTKRNPVERFLSRFDGVVTQHVLRRLHKSLRFGQVHHKLGRIGLIREQHMDTREHASERA